MAIRIAIFIDAANLEKSAQGLGFQIHFRRLLRLFYRFGKVVYAGYYTVFSENNRQRAFLKSLTRFGYTVRSKPLKIINDAGSKGLVRKANFDVEIAVDAMENPNYYDLVVLFSGDSDFAYLIKRLKLKSKKVLVISTRHRVAKELIQTADRYLDLGKLGCEIGRKTKRPAFGLAAPPGSKSSLETAINSILTE